MLEVDDETGHSVAEVAKPISDKDLENATIKDFVVQKINLGVASRAVDAKHLKFSTKRMISKTWKDEKDKRELKQIVTQMAEYINAIHHPSPQPLTQLSLSFNPVSLVNQRLLDQVERSHMIAEIFDEWLDSIVEQGTYYIASLIKVNDNAIIVSKDLQLEATTWDKEINKWVEVLEQMNDVQKIGIMKFLAKKPVDNLDDNVLYVSRKNIEWRNSIIKQGHEESIKLLKVLKELIDTMHKDLKCIDIQLLKDDRRMIELATDMVKNFKERVQHVKETKSLATNDFCKVARIESMLAVCFDHLEAHKIKVMQVNMDKEVWK